MFATSSCILQLQQPFILFYWFRISPRSNVTYYIQLKSQDTHAKTEGKRKMANQQVTHTQKQHLTNIIKKIHIMTRGKKLGF